MTEPSAHGSHDARAGGPVPDGHAGHDARRGPDGSTPPAGPQDPADSGVPGPGIDAPLFASRLDPALTTALEEFATHERILVALDFDGTLAPLVTDPSASRMTPAAAEAVEGLAGAPGVYVAIVSGRDARTVAELADLPAGVAVVGSHGAELGRVRDEDDGSRSLVHEPPELTEEHATLLAEVTRRLEVLAGTADGAWVEHKPSSVVLHTRNVERRSDAGRITEEAVDGPGKLLGTRTILGKEVVEIGVLNVTKGDGVHVLRTELGAQAVFYGGDDTTDEDAFAVLGDTDLSIKVGEGSTRARFRVADPDEFAFVLLHLLALRS